MKQMERVRLLQEWLLRNGTLWVGDLRNKRISAVTFKPSWSDAAKVARVPEVVVTVKDKSISVYPLSLAEWLEARVEEVHVGYLVHWRA